MASGICFRQQAVSMSGRSDPNTVSKNAKVFGVLGAGMLSALRPGRWPEIAAVKTQPAYGNSQENDGF